VKADFERFITELRAFSDAPVVFISIKPNPGRWPLKTYADEVNAWLKARCEADESLTFLDVVPSMLQNGEPREELWIEDGVHLQPAGYTEWAALLQPLLV
jgi:lysophospholipase L1-like esterase